MPSLSVMLCLHAMQHEYLEKINKTFEQFDDLHKVNVGMRQQFEKRYLRCREKQKNLQERMLQVVGRAHKHLMQVRVKVRVRVRVRTST